MLVTTMIARPIIGEERQWKVRAGLKCMLFVQELKTQRGKNEKRVKEDLKVKIEELKVLKKPLETRTAAAERRVGQRAPSPPIMDGLMTAERSYYR